jgi:hypothetical protein
MSVDLLSNLSENGYWQISAFKMKFLVDLIAVYMFKIYVNPLR